MPHDPAAAPGLDEIRSIFAHFPAGNAQAEEAVGKRFEGLAAPHGALGRLEELAMWMAEWQGKHRPTVEHPRICVFAGTHGIAARDVDMLPFAATADAVQAAVTGTGPIAALARTVDADLRVYELALDDPTGDIAEDAALSEADCAHAMTYGMMAVEPGVDLLCLGDMSTSGATVAAALCLALFGGTVAEWTGLEAVADAALLLRRQEAVQAAVSRHGELRSDPLALLAAIGGREHAAIVGAIVAARMAKVPVLLDGYAATAAAAVLWSIDPAHTAHCQVAHLSAEHGHRRLLEELGQKPLLDLQLCQGSAIGAALAVPLLRSAVALLAVESTAEAG